MGVAASLRSESVAPSIASRRLRARALLLVAGVAIVAALAAVTRAHRVRPPLPSYGHVPVFHLVDQRGAPFSDESMLGHVTVVDFIFTRCTASCPRLTARMADLQARLARDGSSARLLSFSVDPDNDTPAVLDDYAARWHADPTRWSFLTGAVDEVKTAVVSGFKVALDKEPSRSGDRPNDYDVIHGNWFVLVDPRGDLRGYYEVDEPSKVDVLASDVRRLERAKP